MRLPFSGLSYLLLINEVTGAFVSVSVDDVQLSCYRILTCVYSLGTGKNIFVER